MDAYTLTIAASAAAVLAALIGYLYRPTARDRRRQRRLVRTLGQQRTNLEARVELERLRIAGQMAVRPDPAWAGFLDEHPELRAKHGGA